MSSKVSKNIVTLYINSKDRQVQSDPSTNFIYNLFPLGIYNCKSFFVKAASIPLTNYVTVYPPKTGFTTQAFVLINPAGSSAVNITPGNYTAPQLATTIQNELNAVGAPFTYAVTYNSITNTFTVTSSTSFTLEFTNNNAAYPYQSIGSTMGYRLEDALHSPANFTGFTLTAPFEASLSGPLNYYIRSSSLTVSTNSFFQGDKSNIISCIPNNSAPFGVINYINPAPYFEPLFSTRLSQFDLALVDEFNNPVILNDDWTVVIAFHCDE